MKLIALARIAGGAVEAGVMPAYVSRAHPFARPDGAENVVRLVGRGCGPLEFFGLGAGGDASASSVVGDIVGALDARRAANVPLRRTFADAASVQPLQLASVEGTTIPFLG